MLPAFLGCLFITGLQESKPAPTQADLDRLVVLYKELKLPLPPPEAPLVKSIPWTDDGSSGGVYLIKQGTKETGSWVMKGTSIVHDLNWHFQPFDLKTLRAEQILGWMHGPPFNQDSMLFFAIVEKTRGNDRLALDCLKRVYLDPPGFSKFVPPMPRPASGKYEDFLVAFAANHWMNQIFDAKVDRRVPLAELTTLTTNHPWLKNEFVSGAIKGLEATIKNRYTGSDKTEQLIDALCDSSVIQYSTFGIEENDKGKLKEVEAIVDLGYSAMPALIKHFEDPRLSRGVFQSSFGTYSSYVTVGEICTNLAREMAGMRAQSDTEHEKNEVKVWWSNVSSRTDKNMYLSALSKGDANGPSEAVLRNVSKRYPDLLSPVLDDILKNRKQQYTWGLLQAMKDSSLDRKDVAEAALRACRSGNYDHVHAGLWVLRDVDKDRFEKTLVWVLKNLPNKLKDSFNSRVASFAQIVGNSDSPIAWQTLADITVKAERDLKVEYIRESLSVREFSKIGKHEALRFLLGFIDDTALTGWKSQGKDARERSIGEDVAMYAGHILQVTDMPAYNAPVSDWTKFRATMKMRIKAEIGAGG